MAMRVVLADDHTLMRKGLKLLVEMDEAFEVVGEADDGRAAVDLTLRLEPDVVLMDLWMDELNGIDATRQIRQQRPNLRVIALSASADRRHVIAAFQAGAAGYVLKDAAVDELVEAIHEVSAGRKFLSPRLADNVIRECVFGVGASTAAGGSALTAREREVLQHLADGKAMKEIGKLLSISTKTVESHRRAIMEKLQLFSTAELTKHAVREGLSTLD